MVTTRFKSSRLIGRTYHARFRTPAWPTYIRLKAIDIRCNRVKNALGNSRFRTFDETDKINAAATTTTAAAAAALSSPSFVSVFVLELLPSYLTVERGKILYNYPCTDYRHEP